MGVLANVSSRNAIRAFQKAGFRYKRQRGGHIQMDKAGSEKVLSSPERRELSTGSLRTLIRDANLPVDEFLALL